jgi:hypothetical protein
MEKEVIEYLAVHKLVQDNNIMIDKAPQWNRYVFHIIEKKNVSTLLWALTCGKNNMERNGN